MTLTLPPDELIDAIHGSFTRVTARVDIYEADGQTPWMLNAPFTDGSVSISGSRDERRTASLTLENVDGSLSSDPDGFWYDKIVKIYRGVITSDTALHDSVALEDNNILVTESTTQVSTESSSRSWEQSLGVFQIDSIRESNFPHLVDVALRDRTKRLLHAKFAVSTTFPINQPIEEVIRAIAINGGISSTQISFPLTGKSTGREFMFDHGTERWKAMSDIASAYNYDLFFRGDGVLTMEAFKDPADPAVSPAEYIFETGVDGNMATFDRSTADARLYNHIVVTGEATDTLPVVSQAENNDLDSPTRIDRIGRRTYFYTSSFITTTQQAQEVADRFLKIRALEQYEVNIESIVAPYLDANIIVEFHDPRPNSDPIRFLLTDITIPLNLGLMSSTAKRVRIVEADVPNLIHESGDILLSTGGQILL